VRKAPKTVSRNFRFDGESAQALEFESNRKGISLNSLVNNIFRKYSQFDRLAERTDMVILSRYMLMDLLGDIPPETLSEKFYEFGTRSARDNLLFWKKGVTVETLRDYIATNLCDYCNLAEYDVTEDGRTFVLTHDLGPNGTTFLKAYVSGFISGCLNEKVPVIAVGSTIKFTLNDNLSART
jgi:hypothetical protein